MDSEVSTPSPILIGEACRLNRYAIEVEKKYASSFSPPGAKILESAEVEEKGTVGFIVEFEEEDLPSEILCLPGVLGAEPMW
jgi:hypothetical protein